MFLFAMRVVEDHLRGRGSLCKSGSVSKGCTGDWTPKETGTNNGEFWVSNEDDCNFLKPPVARDTCLKTFEVLLVDSAAIFQIRLRCFYFDIPFCRCSSGAKTRGRFGAALAVVRSWCA